MPFECLKPSAIAVRPHDRSQSITTNTRRKTTAELLASLIPSTINSTRTACFCKKQKIKMTWGSRSQFEYIQKHVMLHITQVSTERGKIGWSCTGNIPRTMRQTVRPAQCFQALSIIVSPSLPRYSRLSREVYLKHGRALKLIAAGGIVHDQQAGQSRLCPRNSLSGTGRGVRRFGTSRARMRQLIGRMRESHSLKLADAFGRVVRRQQQRL